MAQVKVFYDEVGNTLTVWFGNPEDEHVAEETGDEVVLMKDKTGTVIGFEKLNFSIAKPKHLQLPLRRSLRNPTLSSWRITDDGEIVRISVRARQRMESENL